MAYDFRANQVRLNRIISSGSIPIIIYPASSATDFQGGKNFPDPGSDVFLFVSGSETAKTAFGGDVVVSSSLRVLGSITASVISGSKTDIPALQQLRPNAGALLVTSSVVVSQSLMLFDGPTTPYFNEAGGIALANGALIDLWTGPADTSTYAPVFVAQTDIVNDNALVGVIGTFIVGSGSSINGSQVPTFSVVQSPTPNSSDVLLTGSLQVRGGITGSISGTIDNLPFILSGPNITASYNSLGQWEITGSAGGGSSTNYWISDVNKVVYTTGSANATVLSASLGAIITGSFVQGQPGNVFATGTNAFAHGGWGGSGIGVEARGNYSHAEGGSTITTVGAIFGHAEGSGTQAQNIAAHSEGNGTVASGEASHTEGYQTTATQNYAHAEGYQTHATAQGAHAEGSNTTASNQYAHAEGINTIASGLYSHAEGNSTYATDDGAHAEGQETQATGKYSHAAGYKTTAAGDYSYAGGSGTEAFANNQTVVGTYNNLSNTTSLFVVGDGTSPGTRNDVLRVNTGRVEVTGSLSVSDRITGSLHLTNGGLPFIAAGTNVTTKFNSLGQWEISSSGGGGGGSNYWVSDVNNVVHTTGSANATVLSASLGVIVTGSYIQGDSHTINPSLPIAYGCHVIGRGHTIGAYAGFSSAEGYGNKVAAAYGHGEGEANTVNGQSAHAEGSNNVANGKSAHTEGDWTSADASYSHTEGDHTRTNNLSTYNIGMYAHAEGGYTQTYGTWSHAEGYGSIAYGEGSHAGGLYTIASGSTPPTGNGGTITLPQTAYGKYNKRNNTTSLFVVGDGTGDSDALRHDVLRVESGSVQVTGSLAVNGGITGSLRYVNNTTPYLVGSGITVNYNGSGQYELSASGGTISNSTTVTGDGTNRGSGSIGGLFGLSAGQIGKYEVQVVAVDSGGTSSATWNFSVSGFYPTAGSFSFLGINELTFDHSTSAASWDVNFNDSGQIEVTGSTGGTFFYTQITAKMIAGYGSVVF